MNAQQFLAKYQGQSLLYAPSGSREVYRGQCVQAVCFYVAENGLPVLWVDTAYEWWTSNQRSDVYDRIANTASAVPLPGDIIIWNSQSPGSNGAGHIAVCLSPNQNTFISADSNWGGKTVHAVTHNYNYVVGWIRFKKAAAQIAAKGVDMIPDADNYYGRYGVDLSMRLRNRALSRDEFRQNIAGRTDLQAVEILSSGPEADATQQAQEVGTVAIRDNWQGQIYTLQDVQHQQQIVINQQNQTITDFTQKLNDANLSNAEKQQALDKALADMANQNTRLAELHDQLSDASKKPTEATSQTVENKPADVSWLVKLIAALLRK